MLHSHCLFQVFLVAAAVQRSSSFVPSTTSTISRTVGHLPTNAGVSNTRRYILQDYNSAGLDTSFEDDDEHMDQWLNARLDAIRNMSREELEWELYHNDVDCRGSHEELVCRLLKARLETSHQISAPPEEYLAQKTYEASQAGIHFEDAPPMRLEEPTISSFEDDDDMYLEANLAQDVAPDEHWSTTNDRQAAISLDAYDDSRRRQHFERNKEWFNDRKSSFPGNHNQFIIDDEDLGGTASFSNTGSTTFPNEYTVVQPEEYHDPFEIPHHPDSHFHDEFEVRRKAPKRQPRDLYRPSKHTKTNAHEQSQGRALYKADDRPKNKIHREPSCIELPLSMHQGVPMVSLHMQRGGEFDSEATQFIVDTARHTSAIAHMAVQRLNLPGGASGITTTTTGATAHLKSAQDDQPQSYLLSSSDEEDDEDSITLSGDQAGSMSTSKKTPEHEAPSKDMNDQSVSVDGFWTDSGIFFEAPVEMEILDEDEQMIQSHHGCLGMDILSTFDSVEFDFDHSMLRLYMGDAPKPDFVMAEATIQPLPLKAELPDLYTLPLRVDGKGPANMLISTALPNTVMTWKGVNDSLGLSRHSNEISDIESTFSPHSTVASHFTHYLTVLRKLDLGTGKRLIRFSDNMSDNYSPSLPGLPHLVGANIPVGQFPINIGRNEELNQAFERKRTGGIIGMDILSRCSVLRLSMDRTMEIQMFSRHTSHNNRVVLRP